MPIITGTDQDDVLSGSQPNGTADSIFGRGGNDTIDGLGGADQLYGEAGDDRFIVSVADPTRITLDGGAGHDTLDLSRLPSGFLRVRFDQEISRLYVDNFIGSPTFDELFTAFMTGVEELVLGRGNDAFVGVGPFAVIRGGDGNDSLNGQGLHRQIWNAVLHGDAGDDTLTGYGGNTLYGGVGNDTLIVGGANPFRTGDVLRADGGAGVDRLVLGFDIANVVFRNENGVTWLDARTTSEYGVASAISVSISGIERFDFNGRQVVIDDASPLVDDLFYLLTYRDVAAALTQDADSHYNSFGWREGRDPNAFFDTSAYLAANRDVAAAGINPLAHFNANGAREGRDPSLLFDSQQYLADHPDVAAAGLDALTHYLVYGAAEGRVTQRAVGAITQNGFDAQFYLMSYPDVAVAGVDPYQHFMQFGWREGRDPNAYFDTDYYLSRNPDVAAAWINPFAHYSTFGWREGRDPSRDFDVDRYLSANTDVSNARIDPLLHFLVTGRLEGRESFAASTMMSAISTEPVESLPRLESLKDRAGPMTFPEPDPLHLHSVDDVLGI